MSPALQSLITSPEGIITLGCGILIGLVIGVCIMAGVGHWEDRTRTRLSESMAKAKKPQEDCANAAA